MCVLQVSSQKTWTSTQLYAGAFSGHTIAFVAVWFMRNALGKLAVLKTAARSVPEFAGVMF
jgi:hypothetical protein